MAEEYTAPPAGDITDNDRLMAALSYPLFPIISIIILLVEDMKERPFQKYHAVQALGAGAALWVIVFVLACVLGAISFFIGGLCGILPILLWFVTLYWAYEAYQGKYFEVQWVTQFMKGQNWL